MEPHGQSPWYTPQAGAIPNSDSLFTAKGRGLPEFGITNSHDFWIHAVYPPAGGPQSMKHHTICGASAVPTFSMTCRVDRSIGPGPGLPDRCAQSLKIRRSWIHFRCGSLGSGLPASQREPTYPVLRCGTAALCFQEGQQVGVKFFLMCVREAVGRARVDLQCRVPDQLR